MKFSDLEFVRLDKPGQFKLIPRILFEQVKEADFKIDRLYQFGPVLLASPLTFLFVLAAKEQIKNGYAPVKGFLWTEINPFNESLIVNTFSIDKEYQGDGALAKTLDFVKKIQKEQGLQKIQITTKCPKTYERKHGWHKSKRIIMEIE